MTETLDQMDVYGTGLKNEIGEYNCFLNVIIQVWYRNLFPVLLCHCGVGFFLGSTISLVFLSSSIMSMLSSVIFGVFYFQSLWHLQVTTVSRWIFEEVIIRTCTCWDPCVVCALHDIFSALNTASVDARREAVAPTSLRIALSNLYPYSNFFQEVNLWAVSDGSSLLFIFFSSFPSICNFISL